MARIEDKINEIKDTELRRIIAGEVRELKDLLTEKRRFGLVFEDHQPELVPIFSKAIRAHLSVAKKSGNLAEIWRVLRVKDGIADLKRDGDDGKIETEQASVDGLVVVRRTGEPIYPSLVPVGDVSRGNPAQPHHILIEADNFHALQLLEYVYRGKIDCIYIDPPYNTGARDWKYNNDYVDSVDACQHSKWLSFMERRLLLAKRLLAPQGVLVVTIDQNEVHRLGIMLDQTFPEFEKTMVTIVIHGRGNAGTNFDRVEEFAFFLTPHGNQVIQKRILGSYNSQAATDGLVADTRTFVRTGNNSTPDKRPGMDYPIWVNTKNGSARVGEVRKPGAPRSSKQIGLEIPIWPVDERGYERVWRRNPAGARKALADGHLETKFDDRTKRWRIRVTNMKSETINHRTVWFDPSHAAKNHGTALLTDILGSERFSFPKSIYAVRDCLAAITANKSNAYIVDFFAGSGTTLNAVNLLNAADGGHRQCILVTNNEVSEAGAQTLSAQGLYPGSDEWEAQGICQSVTWPRSKFTINGQRDDGVHLPGDYLTGRTVTKEKARTVKQLAFAEGRILPLQQRKQLAGLIDGIPQSKIEAGAAWFLDDDSPISVLWDATQAEGWLEAIAVAEHVGTFYVVTQETRLFNQIKVRVLDALPPLAYEEEERRPLAQGFDASLAYFKLDFLDPNELQMGRQFAAILPILWMMAGARGPRPEAPSPHAPWLIPEGCPFVVLLQETRAKDFMRHVVQRTDLTHVFIVTNARDLYQKLRGEFEGSQVVQLYKDYLENFKINLSRD